MYGCAPRDDAHPPCDAHGYALCVLFLETRAAEHASVRANLIQEDDRKCQHAHDDKRPNGAPANDSAERDAPARLHGSPIGNGRRTSGLAVRALPLRRGITRRRRSRSCRSRDGSRRALTRGSAADGGRTWNLRGCWPRTSNKMTRDSLRSNRCWAQYAPQTIRICCATIPMRPKKQGGATQAARCGYREPPPHPRRPPRPVRSPR